MVSKSIQEHNDSAYLNLLQTLKNKGVPGRTTLPKVEYFMDNYPQIKAKDIAEIIGVGINSVHTAKWQIRKNRKAAEAQNEQNNDAHQEPEPSQKAETHIDIWDQQHEPYVPDPVYTQEPTYAPPEPIYTQEPIYAPQNPVYAPQNPVYAPQAAPVHIQPVIPPQTLTASRGVVFELGVNGTDGATLRALISVVYGKILDNKKYKVHIKIEEE